MEYKLEFNEEQPKLNYIRILSGQFENALILIGDIKLTTNEKGGVDEMSVIADFVYRVQEDGLQVDEIEIPLLTNVVAEILCNLLNTDMA